eukprot:CAMPEP_0113662010 /NCGR_PEP_ID=MMETSP0038_2-20120614/319_1 /TAXON_ID=2898 /ORGANISM="Cryptomonas paramecium" /LENGTH=116 /DNA_ID=CAMNT_0000576819 /DNA_START=271 /DNA_END=618 /DNA_ORIENTATION=+ /assembly_acc=CAM_ASM_000170
MTMYKFLYAPQFWQRSADLRNQRELSVLSANGLIMNPNGSPSDFAREHLLGTVVLLSFRTLSVVFPRISHLLPSYSLGWVSALEPWPKNEFFEDPSPALFCPCGTVSWTVRGSIAK